MNETFETYRSYLFAIAYRMLGSAMDAEDMVQETYLRYQTTPPETIHSLKAYLATIISRLCVDHLQLARYKREQYLGPWLPEPIVTTDAPELTRVEKRVDEYESISLAFLVQTPSSNTARRWAMRVGKHWYHFLAQKAGFEYA
jgi:RNA polymerase sigma-70 factor (ECF subfamily)